MMRSIALALAGLVGGLLIVACNDLEEDPFAEARRLGGEPEAAAEMTEPGAGSETSSQTQVTKTGLPCAVSEVLSKNCQTCHGATPTSGASTPLVTWDDLQKPHQGKKLFEVVKERVHAEAGRMPPTARMTDADLKAIDEWVAGGAKKDAGTCTTTKPAPTTKPFTCNGGKVTELKAAKPFTWERGSTKTDRYMCFGVEEAVAKKRHIISMGPKVDNAAMLHHILVFQASTPFSSTPQECSEFTPSDWKLVGTWAPGGGNFELPPEAGYPQQGNTHWVLQMHYNNASGKNAGGTDNSGYQICSTENLRANDAGIMAFGSIGFMIPPRTSKHTIKCDYVLGPEYQNVKLFAAAPHMHTRGKSIVTERIPMSGGAPDVVYGQTPFIFESQEAYPINKTVSAGDVMRTRCTWSNPGDTPIGFGEKTDDEMCFNFMSYYPAVPSFNPLVPQWVSPSVPVPLGGVTCVDEN